jgi:GABA permease
MRRYLVVANQTLGSERLLDMTRSAMAEEPCRFHLVVPASEPRCAEGAARALAGRRLEAALARLRSSGANVTGAVGDGSRVTAIADLLMIDGAFDEIILSTLRQVSDGGYARMSSIAWNECFAGCRAGTW